MNRLFTIATIVLSLGALQGCERIHSGEIGLRQNFNGIIDSTELQPGSLNQKLVGHVLVFKVQETGVEVSGKDNGIYPQASDNSTLKDFDVTAIYQINPAAVADIWKTKNRGYHGTDDNGDILLMKNYLAKTLSSASYKAVRPYPALQLNDHRSDVEGLIQKDMMETLKQEGLDTAITIRQVQVRTMLPANTIIDSANNLVKANNELQIKTVQVQTAQKEAERIAALTSNPKNIDYMNAQTNQMIAQAVLDGKVHAIVLPHDFRGMVNLNTGN